MLSEVTYTARWLFPVAGPPLPQGTLTVLGDTIRAVAPHGTRTADVDLGNAALLPGFVNAHTHLDLSGARGVCPPAPDFTQWLRSVIAFRRTRTPEQVQADIAAGLAECQRHGTTLIGDVSAGGASWDVLAQAECWAWVFYELLGLTEERSQQTWRDLQAWWQARAANDHCSAGLSPHAPYSVRSTLYSVLSTRKLPIMTHLAETREELELLRTHSGPFADLLRELNVWDPAGLVKDVREVLRLLPRGLFVHGNYLDPATRFLPEQALVVCPRTHAAFGHPRHPFPQMKVRVALGTDSLASSPDLDLLAEARFLRTNYPEVAPAEVLCMLTRNGAEALGFGNVTGSLTPGKSADLVVLALPAEETRDPHDLVLQARTQVQQVMFRGEWVREASA